MVANRVTTNSGQIVENPPLARLLFDDKRLAAVWLVVRVLVGWEWLQAGWHKVTDPGWVQTGEALKGFWTRIAAIPETGSPVIKYDWYRSFIQGMLDSGSYTWFAKVIAFGETAIGIGLILGAFVGVAAFFGAVMNWNFIMAGSTSSNPILFVGAIFLVLSWKIAGYYGLDRYLLRYLGTPWQHEAKVQTTKLSASIVPESAGD
ncbi:MAG: DoxX family protein [Anaerolineae bacterium]|nr:DoxX family protein [Anaerolineae bacterium]